MARNHNPYVVAMASMNPAEGTAIDAIQQITTPTSLTAETSSRATSVQQNPTPATVGTTRTYNGTTYDTARDYAGEALTAINGVGGAYDPDVYRNVQEWYNARNAKIADNQAHYDAQGIGTADAAGQQMADYLSRYQVQNALPQSPQPQQAVQQQPSYVQQLQQNAQQSAQQQKISGVDFSSLRTLLDDWLTTAQQQAGLNTDYSVQQGITELQRAQEDAQPQFDQQYAQIARDEAVGRDNSALYAAARGDRGGIGQAQYDAIAATAAANRATVRTAQVKLATDTQRQITDLRMQGEFKKAEDYLNLTQQYLSQLMSLQQFAISTNLDVARFNSSVDQWYAEYAQKLQQMQISVDQWQAEFDNSNYWNALKFNEDVRQYEQGFQRQLDRDAQSDYQWQQEFQRALDRDQVSDYQWEQEFKRLLNRDAYSDYRDQVSDEQWAQQFNRQLSRDEVSDYQWLQRFNEDSRQFWTQLETTAAQRNQSALADYAEMLVKQGVMPDAETLSALGWNQSAVQSYVDVIQSQQYMDALVSMSKVSGVNAAGATGDVSEILGVDGTTGLSSFYTTKPNLSAANVNTAIDNYMVTEGVRQAYAYYYGESYFNQHEDELSDAARGYLNVFTNGKLNSEQMESHFERFQQDVANGIIQPSEADYIIRQTQQRATRLARTTQGRINSVLDAAANEIGFKETNSNNKTPYGKWYNGGEFNGQPWCMMFVDYVFDQAGMYDLLPTKTASTTVFANAAKKAGNWHTDGDYQPGDVILFDRNKKDSAMDHVGIIKEVKENGTIVTIEGNTSDSVAERTYKPGTSKYNEIAGTFRPDYGSDIEAQSPPRANKSTAQTNTAKAEPVDAVTMAQPATRTVTSTAPSAQTTSPRTSAGTTSPASTTSSDGLYEQLYSSFFEGMEPGSGMSDDNFKTLKESVTNAMEAGRDSWANALITNYSSKLTEQQRRELIGMFFNVLNGGD